MVVRPPNCGFHRWKPRRSCQLVCFFFLVSPAAVWKSTSELDSRNLISTQACYVISGQKKHNDDIAILVVYTMTFFWYVCKLFVGRLLVVARRAPVESASVKPVDALGSLDLP